MSDYKTFVFEFMDKCLDVLKANQQGRESLGPSHPINLPYRAALDGGMMAALGLLRLTLRHPTIINDKYGGDVTEFVTNLRTSHEYLSQDHDDATWRAPLAEATSPRNKQSNMWQFGDPYSAYVEDVLISAASFNSACRKMIIEEVSVTHNNVALISAASQSLLTTVSSLASITQMPWLMVGSGLKPSFVMDVFSRDLAFYEDVQKRMKPFMPFASFYKTPKP